MSRTFYDVLDVPRDASQDEILSAYRERVKETHPDLADDADAADRFREVQRAEEVLGDPDERARYDRLGHAVYTRYVGAGEDVFEGGRWPGQDRRASTDEASSASYSVSFGGTKHSSAGSSTDTTDPSTDPSGSTGDDPFAWEATSGVAEDDAGGSSNRDDGFAGGEPESGYDGFAGDSTGGYAVHDWGPEDFEHPPVRAPITQTLVVTSATIFVLYPVLVWSSVTPAFSLWVNVVVGLCTLSLVAWLITIPRVGMAVFGGWSLLAPAAVTWLTDWDPLALPAVFSVAVCWIPFAYAAVVERFTR